MVIINKLRGKIVERGLNVPEVAKSMGMDKATLYRRFADGDTFTIGEVRKITEILSLSHEETVEIFLSQ